MRLEPEKKKLDPFESLSPVQKKSRKAAVIVAFIGSFAWVVKILFF
ncbi:hypothetical protein [Mucilaginibacter sp. SG564]|nr:hypothetical protein [Mucilaginibacter sp. SG564]NOW94089.1 hypothetical protein [Mucilaginibacter sp. SG564]